jgi:hypothetical protein
MLQQKPPRMVSLLCFWDPASAADAQIELAFLFGDSDIACDQNDQ